MNTLRTVHLTLWSLLCYIVYTCCTRVCKYRF